MPDRPIDAYVLVSNGSAGDTEGILRGEAPLGRWRAHAVGAFDAVVALEADDTRDLHEQIRGLRRALGGAVRTETLVAVRPRQPCPVKRTSLPDGEMAFTLLNVAPRQKQAVLTKVNGSDGVRAAAIVTGTADLLVQVEADDFHSLLDAVEALGEIDDVQSTRTTFVEPIADGSTSLDLQAT